MEIVAAGPDVGAQGAAWGRRGWYDLEVQGGWAAAVPMRRHRCIGREESPSTIGPGCRLTAGRGDPTESATETTLPCKRRW